MGCDIHMFVEVKKDGKWVTADTWEKCKDGSFELPYRKEIYSECNYDLFAILANVRNGYGFALVDTGDGFVPIAKPRGIPDDCCDEIKKEYDSWKNDGHSHSWYLVSELLEYDWTKITKKRGVLNAVEYYRWNLFKRKSGEGPDSYCGPITGGDIINVTEKEMNERISFLVSDSSPEKAIKLLKNNMQKIYCKVEWEESYHRACSYFWSETIPKLLSLGKSDQVRIVFWFDN